MALTGAMNGNPADLEGVSDMEEALLAIIARIDGDWDNEHLVSFGALSVDPIEDIRRLAAAGLRLEAWIADQSVEVQL